MAFTDDKLGVALAVACVVTVLALLRLCCCRRRAGARRTAVAETKVVPCTGTRLLDGPQAGSASCAGADDDSFVPDASEWTQVEELRRLVQQSGIADRFLGGKRWYEDFELLRFVRARPTLAESEQLFNEAMAWRHEQQDKWHAAMKEGSFGAAWATYTSGKVAAPEWWAFLKASMPQALYGADQYGLPIMYSGTGYTDLQGCEREVGFEALQCFAVMMNDHFLDTARALGADKRGVVHGGLVIVNLEGLAMRHLREAAVFKRMSAVAKFLHPERQRKCFIINAPSIFAAVWRIISPIVDPRTAARITILSSGDSLAPLISEVGEHNVPDFLGGSYAGLPGPVSGDARIPQGAFSQWRGL